MPQVYLMEVSACHEVLNNVSDKSKIKLLYQKHILSLIYQMHHKDHHVMCSLLSNVFEAFNDKNLGMRLEEVTQFNLDCIFSEIKSFHCILVNLPFKSYTDIPCCSCPTEHVLLFCITYQVHRHELSCVRSLSSNLL
jgi:hypothetical protein